MGFDISEFQAFADGMSRAADEIKNAIPLMVEAGGYELLRITQDEIIRRKVMDTRLLLSSFTKNNDGNLWKTSVDGLTLEVGSTVNYAEYVNNGHLTVSANSPGAKEVGPFKRVARFVPGYWQGDRFVYDRNAKGGMMLYQTWVEGAHYWEGVVNIFQRMFPDLADAKLKEILSRYLPQFQ